MSRPERRARMSPAGRRIMAAGIAVIGLAVTVFAARFGGEADRAASPVLGAPAPGLPLPRLDGGDGAVDLAALGGAYEVVAVNFFASWCLQCRNEHAGLAGAAEAYRGRSVRFVGVVFQDDPGRARAFLDELGWAANTDYASDPGARAAIELGVFGVPETIFIRGGRVAGKLLGETDALTLSSALEQILAGGEVEPRRVGEYRQSPGGR